MLVRVSQNSSLLSVINKLFVTFSVVVTQTVQLSDADKELLARWAGMQKNQPKETSTQQHQQATSAAASSTGLVYIQPAPANSSSVGQTKSTSNFSPAHPGSSSTSPTNVHSDYVSQVAIIAGPIVMPQGSSGLAQIVGPDNNPVVVSLQGNLVQGQTAIHSLAPISDQQQQNSRSSFLEGGMMPILTLQGQEGNGIHITKEQAEVLKEVLKMTPSAVSGGNHGEGFNSRCSLTPLHVDQALSTASDSQVQAGVTPAGAVFLPSSMTSSASPFSSSQQTSPAVSLPPLALNQRTSSPGFAHSPVSVNVQEESVSAHTNLNRLSLHVQQTHFQTTQPEYGQTGKATMPESSFGCHASTPDSFSRASVTTLSAADIPVVDRPHDPQDLSEFLDRHCTDSQGRVDSTVFHRDTDPIGMMGMKESKSPFSLVTSSQDRTSKQEVYAFSQCGQFSQQIEGTSPSLLHSQDSKVFFSQPAGIQPSYNNSAATPTALSTNTCFSGAVFAGAGGASSMSSVSSVHLSPQQVADSACVHSHNLYMMPRENMQYSHCERPQHEENRKSLSFGHLAAGSTHLADQFSSFVQSTGDYQGMKVPITQSNFDMSECPCFGSHPDLVHAHMVESHSPRRASENSFAVGQIFQTQSLKCCMPQELIAPHHHQPQQQQPPQQQMLSEMLQQQQHVHVHNQGALHQHHSPLVDCYQQQQLLTQPLQQNPQQPQQSQDQQQQQQHHLPRNKGPGLRVSAPKQDASADLIAMLSKQLSKSQLESIFPPALSLTPRGTGAGYGVGMDLDLLMADTLDTNNRLVMLTGIVYSVCFCAYAGM